MTARIFLILIGGTIVSGALVAALAAHERKELDEHTHNRHIAERVEQIILMLDVTPASTRPAIANVATQYGIRVTFSPSMTVIGQAAESEIATEIKTVLGDSRSISVSPSSGAECPARAPSSDAAKVSDRHCETVLTSLKDGTPIRLDVTRRDRLPPPFRGNFLRDIFLFLSGLTLIALIIAHMATQPLRRLAQAAHDLSRNIEHKPLPVNTGLKEVREASLAFNRMQSSIHRHIEERICMLAAIAHDLQTPLTRLRLRLEKVTDTDLRTALVADLAATQAMVREGLEFARTLSTDEPFERVDLDSLIEAICNDATDAGWDVTSVGKVGKFILASPHALRRCISNLVDNAVKYGERAHIGVSCEGNKAIISIIDGGTGIPASQLESIFQPFSRLENSRSRNSGGTGLGLTIARIIAEKHKGTITLSNMDAAELGLKATIEIPLSS